LQGIGCNAVSPEDTANFLSFLQELRTTITGNKLIISVPVAAPFADASGSPSTNVSAFKDVLDFITVMNYDTGSNSSFGVGPNSPLDDLCAPISGQRSSATTEIDAWAAAGMPLDQIVLGVPAYGRGYSVSKQSAYKSGSILAPYPAYSVSNTPPGDKWSAVGGIDVCGINEGPGGVYTYWGLMEEGFLNTDGTIKTGIAYRYDNCSQTVSIFRHTHCKEG
jgi:chitinase